jgi:hypothetical protein
MWRKLWQDVAKGVSLINLAVAVLLFIAPWVVGFSTVTKAAVDAWGVAILLALAAADGLLREDRWHTWAEGILGLWAFLAPWILGFQAETGAVVSHVILGLITVVALPSQRGPQGPIPPPPLLPVP